MSETEVCVSWRGRNETQQQSFVLVADVTFAHVSRPIDLAEGFARQPPRSERGQGLCCQGPGHGPLLSFAGDRTLHRPTAGRDDLSGGTAASGGGEVRGCGCHGNAGAIHRAASWLGFAGGCAKRGRSRSASKAPSGREHILSAVQRL